MSPSTPREPADHDGSDDLPEATDDVRSSRPSKTRRKQASHDLQSLGEALVEMPAKRLADLEMPDSLRDAIRDYGNTRSHEGRRRQMQYIGKLMRRVDPEPLREAVAAMQLGQARDSLALHQAEHWRAELIADDEAVTRWAADYPQSDVQQLRNLVRAARKDASAEPEKRSGKAFRELFRFIRSAQQDKPADD
ncbi:ribosome biogenesis factor YjgA [Piscinibacter sakaiensis]|uniref:ribosome biogenesis factor YjgA n=1 Tax=Piscinibacter sakaiensis TaxID=1547922 RepID=UPI003AAC0ACB